MVDIDNPVLDFTAMDRCSRCGAQAYTLAQHETLGDFLFCLHHRREHYDYLIDNNWIIIDDYEAISNLADGITV